MKTGLAGLVLGLSVAAPAAAVAAAADEPSLPSIPVATDEEATVDAAATATAAAQVIDVGPFRLTAGPQTSGDFGATLKGSGRQAITALSSSWRNTEAPMFSGVMSSFQYSVDGSLSSARDAKNNASLSLRPGVDWLFMRGTKGVASDVRNMTAQQKKDCLADRRKCPIDPAPHELFALSGYADVRYRYGAFAANDTVEHANQLLLGGGTELTLSEAFQWSSVFDEAPRLALAYYTVASTADSNVPVPDELKTDYIALSAHLHLLAPWLDHRIDLTFDASSSRPTKGSSAGFDFLSTAQLGYKLDGSIKPAIVYRTGKEAGLSYDRQLLLGIAYEFADRRGRGN